jgi:hypothetical protein
MKHLGFLFTLLCLCLLSNNAYSQRNLYSFSSVPNTWSLTDGGGNCSCSPTSVDTVYISHNWANASFYPLTHPANLAFGTYFPVSSVNNPFKVVVRSGGVAYQTGSIPTGMILQVNSGGMWAFNGAVLIHGTEPNSISLIHNDGSILANGSFTNKIAITSPGEFCKNGSFNQNSGGTFNGNSDLNLDPYFDYMNYGAWCMNATVLPIELLSFTATRTKDVIIYKWRTASEINNDFFNIYVTNDLNEWILVATESGAGNSFSVIDYTAVSNITDYTYAILEQTDYDGTISSSNIINLGNPNNVKTISEPIKIRGNQVILSSPYNDYETMFYVYDINGKVLYQKMINKSDIINLPEHINMTGMIFLSYGSSKKRMFIDN